MHCVHGWSDAVAAAEVANGQRCASLPVISRSSLPLRSRADVSCISICAPVGLLTLSIARRLCSSIRPLATPTATCGICLPGRTVVAVPGLLYLDTAVLSSVAHPGPKPAARKKRKGLENAGLLHAEAVHAEAVRSTYLGIPLSPWPPCRAGQGRAGHEVPDCIAQWRPWQARSRRELTALERTLQELNAEFSSIVG
jgi:hypothetical protein